MERWSGKVAVVTGASSGIGAAVVNDLVRVGLIVVGLARRDERIREIRNTLPANLQSNLHVIKCDVTIEEDVKNAFSWIEKNLGGTDILVNNAGIFRLNLNLISPDNTQPIREILDTNVMAAVYCVREAFNSMKKRNFDGHVVVVNSVTGHQVPNSLLSGRQSSNMYPPSKFALTAMVETYRQEFANAGTKVKISSISPGLVQTEIIPEEIFENLNWPALQPENISNAILYVIGTPPNVQIHELIIKPIGESM